MSRARDVSNDQANVGGSVAPFTAGKNKIINGDFGVWQRGTSFTNPVSDTGFTADRFYTVWNGTGATATVSQQAFTPGTAPVSGYESSYFLRYNVSVAGSGNTYRYLTTSIEDVRTFAGQTVTFSFWAKASSNTTINNFNIDQNFGSGGSSINYNAFTPLVTSFNVTTSWQRFTVTGTMASLTGKTIGTGSYLRLFLAMPASSTFTIDVWGLQLESGSIATPFTTASGSIGGELALCQRYYYRWIAGNTYRFCASGGAYSTTQANIQIPYPTQMRVGATALDTAGMTCHLLKNDSYNSSGSFSLANQQENNATVIYTHGSAIFTAGDFVNLSSGATATGYIGFTAEL